MNLPHDGTPVIAFSCFAPERPPARLHRRLNGLELNVQASGAGVISIPKTGSPRGATSDPTPDGLQTFSFPSLKALM